MSKHDAPSLVEDVDAYENWLRGQCDVVKSGLDEKHANMAKKEFKFFRATCFRFASTMKILPSNLIKAPKTTSVGDAHIENWGTWRDAEGRLVWGVNDFDDAAILPYTYDLLRLATSARLAPKLPDTNGDKTEAILEGYRDGLDHPGPHFADETSVYLRELIHSRLQKTPSLLQKIDDEAELATPPDAVIHALREQLPSGTESVKFLCWQQGGGSLGRPRYLAVGDWRGGKVVREAKALVASSWDWAAGFGGQASMFQQIAVGRFRAPDPFLLCQSSFVIRRLASDSVKLELADNEAQAFNLQVLKAMGADLASIHLGGRVARQAIIDHLNNLDHDWLRAGAKKLAGAVQDDFKVWQNFYAARAKTAPTSP